MSTPKSELSNAHNRILYMKKYSKMKKTIPMLSMKRNSLGMMRRLGFFEVIMILSLWDSTDSQPSTPSCGGNLWA
jgi:hypothetical protein